MTGTEKWPFPKHPHCGLVAMTYLLSGTLKPWDNHNGKAPFNNTALGLYYINSGHGIIHEEDPIIEDGELHWLQLWINPGVHMGTHTKAFAKLIKPTDIPEYKTTHAHVRIILGEAFGKHSPLTPDWPIQYLHIILEPKQQIHLPLQQKDWQGFVYVLSGTGIFGSHKMTAEKRDCLVLGNEASHELSVENHSNKPLEFVLLTGQPHNKPFYKILAGGGALIADTEEHARDALKRFEHEDEKFGIS
jgi:redox-sensitive bicupin YhaK (pirin superfamily)